MTAPTTTVTHRPTGRTWTVRAFTSKPNNRKRVALRALSVGDDNGRLPCAACGVLTAAVDGTVNASGELVAVGQADRIVNDHPAFTVGVPVAYCEATTANVCPPCNGSRGRALVLPSLERVALELLERHAT